MKKITDALISDHKMIQKLLATWNLDNPRFADLSQTLRRVVLTHAWFEDTVFLPALVNKPPLSQRYLDELVAEHKDIDFFLTAVTTAKPEKTMELEANIRQFRAILENHLRKEEDALFPLAEKVLNENGLNQLNSEMEKRQTEAQKLFNPGK
jgi:hemerythrin-like domain-containing protein